MIDFNLLHPSDQLVMIMERIYEYGMTTTSGGNLSIRDADGDIWITPAGVDKGSLGRKDIVCVRPDGAVVGNHKPSSELPFHRQVYEKRPELRAVLHAHPPALVACSFVRKIPNTKIITSAHDACGKGGMAAYDVPGSERLGARIAHVFEQGYDTVMLENHGLVTAAPNIYQAFLTFETLDFCARVEINARRIGRPVIQKEENLAIALQKKGPDMEEFVPEHHSSEETAARRDMCALIARAYHQRLFTSTQGTFSQRLQPSAGGDSFLITPYMVDRKYIGISDLVRIDNGRREAGKTPSRSVLLHKLIYETQPHINSIIIAHAPNIMAFAVTGAKFDSRTIPESYILLRNMPQLPFGATFMLQQDLADILTPENPVALVENDCVISTGGSLLNAFDRLEVAEYSAKAIISARELGDMVMINDAQIAEINEAFHLT
jgi:L-fuculose-phosphate aldolase